MPFKNKIQNESAFHPIIWHDKFPHQWKMPIKRMQKIFAIERISMLKSQMSAFPYATFIFHSISPSNWIVMVTARIALNSMSMRFMVSPWQHEARSTPRLGLDGVSSTSHAMPSHPFVIWNYSKYRIKYTFHSLSFLWLSFNIIKDNMNSYNKCFYIFIRFVKEEPYAKEKWCE